MAIRVSAACQKLMVEQGLVPRGCLSVELVMSAAGPMLLKYEVYVEPDQFEKFATVFQLMASESKEKQDA